jgi:hypothetical protein
MKARTVKLTLLAAAFVFIANASGYAAPVSVTIDPADPDFGTKVNEILAHPDTVAHRNAIREKIMKEQALAMPIQNNVVDPILTSFLKSKIKAQVMTALRGTMVPGPPPSVNPLGELPGRLAPSF